VLLGAGPARLLAERARGHDLRPVGPLEPAAHLVADLVLERDCLDPAWHHRAVLGLAEQVGVRGAAAAPAFTGTGSRQRGHPHSYNLVPNDQRSLPVPGHRSITEAEKLAAAKLGGMPIHHEQMAVVANIYRAASVVRQHLENSVLRGADLTWTAFVVLWVVWVWGESETRHVAEEAGISKGTLTGVSRTLEGRGLVKRAGHPSDGRLVLLSLTEEGEALMRRLFPEFNQEEAFVTSPLSAEECRALAEGLRTVVLQVEEHGEERRLGLLDGAEPAPRRSGRRAKG